MKDTKISFIGCGNMGRSLIGGMLANGHSADAIRGSETNPDVAEIITREYGIRVYSDNNEAISGADIIILAVKPQHLITTVKTLANRIMEHKPLVISIAAGVRIQSLETSLDTDVPIVRVMPNTPALIQAGASALYANAAVREPQRQLAEEIMRSVGLTVWLESEAQMDAVTALSGSGPAYFFLIMEIMQKAATRLGLASEQARLLTLETAFGAAKMALESDADAATLRQQVTSPGGTTEQALKILMDKGDIETLFFEALSAAKHRSEELAASIEGAQ